jgi:hypothetical protein
MPLSLTDHQLELVMAAAGPPEPDKRVVLMERLVALLRMQGVRPPVDADIALALSRLVRPGNGQLAAAAGEN